MGTDATERSLHIWATTASGLRNGVRSNGKHKIVGEPVNVVDESVSRESERPPVPSGKRLLLLSLAALGIVYGDIGTSPLYAMRACFQGEHGVPVNPANVLGVLSLIFWTLLTVVALKYHVYVLRFDNRGEGGILALMGLVRPAKRKDSRVRWVLVTLGVFGAALLYGDGIITPAISVLSAVEGLEIGTSVIRPFVVPITIALLVGLFLFQRRGTARIGSVFGPIMVLWFVTIAVLGASGIARQPSVLAAFNPVHAVRFFSVNGGRGFLVLGSVFLVATGGEALYADLGHFGERPIQIDWFGLVGISLVANYFGQGALLLHDPAAIENPFFRLGPAWALYPLVILSTIATIIASQAIISGVFSLTRQAVRFGYMPRMNVIHTSPSDVGQIYVPSVNWVLMIMTIALVLGFEKSSRMAAAYGVAVTTTMTITTILAGVVSRDVLHWKVSLAILVTAGFLTIDLSFFAANIVKIASGGWFPLLVAAVIFTIMTTWRKGRQILRQMLTEQLEAIQSLVREVSARKPDRVPGTAVYLSTIPEVTPPALAHNLKFNKVLHERVILVTVVSEEVPRVPPQERTQIENLGENFYRLIVHYGFMEEPNIPDALKTLDAPSVDVSSGATLFFLSKESIVPTRKKPGMAFWREKLFAWMSNNTPTAMLFFCLPSDQTLELRGQIKM
jgi:KUP system potassium uptake protein